MPDGKGVGCLGAQWLFHAVFWAATHRKVSFAWMQLHPPISCAGIGVLKHQPRSMQRPSSGDHLVKNLHTPLQ